MGAISLPRGDGAARTPGGRDNHIEYSFATPRAAVPSLSLVTSFASVQRAGPDRVDCRDTVLLWRSSPLGGGAWARRRRALRAPHLRFINNDIPLANLANSSRRAERCERDVL